MPLGLAGSPDTDDETEDGMDHQELTKGSYTCTQPCSLSLWNPISVTLMTSKIDSTQLTPVEAR